MSDTPDQGKTQDIFLNLDAERRREIESVRDRMEDFLKGQIELKHEMEIVSRGQESLKERFEVGTARTLKELKDSFDAFRVEWGEKKSEDKNRDISIKTAGDSAKLANDKFDDFNKKVSWVVFVALLMILLKFLFTWKF